MAIRIGLHHQTRYSYDRLVQLGPQVIRLKPAPHTRSPVVGYSLRVDPAGHFLNWQQDPQNNWLARVVFPEKCKHFDVSVDLVADLSPINPFDFFLEAYAEEWAFEYPDELKEELKPFLKKLDGSRKAGQLFKTLAKKLYKEGDRTLDFLVSVNQAIQNQLDYTLRMDPGVQTPEETLTLNRGSCRDFAWLLVNILREYGLAARFVSGYSIQLVADQKPLEGPAGVLKDVVDLHAWTEVYLPGAGWVGMDPTSGMMCTEGHIPLATSPDPASAAPISGALGECEVSFQHEMAITRLHEDPRVTKPYTETQWEGITKLAREVDERIDLHDIRLTMGGEPTFISIDDFESDQWNTAAVGTHKFERSIDLVKRLKSTWTRPQQSEIAESSPETGGLLHCGQGKWYPGEQLPRWALSVYWRKDGEPVWHDEKWLADPDIDYKFTREDAATFMKTLCYLLDINQQYLSAAYEDPVHFSWMERKLPINVDVLDNKLETEEDRQRLLRVFKNGLDKPIGYILPIAKAAPGGQKRWLSGLWMLRADTRGGASLTEIEAAEDSLNALGSAGDDVNRKVYLIPGDSPIGLRLPIGSLPYQSPPHVPQGYPQAPDIPRAPLPDYRRLSAQTAEAHIDEVLAQIQKDPKIDLSEPLTPEGVIRTAMCCQPQQGQLRIFMPPTSYLEDYLELLAAIEKTARLLKMPVIIEGYTPPQDPRLDVIKVTPDPGVIEVNIHPSNNWDELETRTYELYEQAKQARLGTEKFMLDGRHTGTGGGNHVVVGANTTLDSPWLRRPDLLRSVISYWNNHPSLSYLFSGLFIGPTSQAPRFDEGRKDAIYEMEIALNQIPLPPNHIHPKDFVPQTLPWLVDRVFRHLLTDLTGNTHRAEICIDKLYSPDSDTGRLGLVEFRGFEMPPHPRMSLTQMLLIRALLVMFWERPYVKPLKRWRTQLHDQFMLPYFIESDFEEVLADLKGANIDFDPAWFIPHTEFRFPVAGRVSVGDIQLELRTAIEPWYVLGEEPAGGATARFVDSSVERMQLKVHGLDVNSDANRYIVTVNGWQVPLQPTGREMESVCGIRYRAWQPPSCLHPTLGVNTPLVLDVVDLWNHKAIGGCSYYVAHPGGRSYDTFPVNALEAEARRKARFTPFGHTPGDIHYQIYPPSHEFPYTLDLRRV